MEIGDVDNSSVISQFLSTVFPVEPVLELVLAMHGFDFQTDLGKYFDNHGPFQLEDALVSGSSGVKVFWLILTYRQRSRHQMWTLCAF